MYIHAAVSIAIRNAFRKQGAPAENYLLEPIRITPLTEEEKAQKAEEERKKVIKWLNGLMKPDKAANKGGAPNE